MIEPQPARTEPERDNSRDAAVILGLAAVSTLIHLALTRADDLRSVLPLYLAGHAALAGLMFWAWRRVRANPTTLKLALVAALLFRLVAVLAPPSLSDDVHRYVWDGRVQAQGHHPYAYAPSDPALAGLRDASWEQINHPELRTIYPPVAQMLFAALAALGAGPFGFKLVTGLADFGVVLALLLLLLRLERPRDRVMLYAWNPLAIVESAGSGHLEPVGVLLLLLAAVWIVRGRAILSMLSLAAGIHVKLLPAVLLPALMRRAPPLAAGALLLALVVPVVPYALGGPAIGAGLFSYAQSWEHNATVYAGVEWVFERLGTGPPLKRALGWLQQRAGDRPVPWDWLYRHVWPRDVARLAVLAAAACWLAALAMRADLDIAQESLLAIGGVLLLSPTLHPWYLLWILPLAAALVSWGWLLLGVTVVLAYVGHGVDVPWPVRALEYLPALAAGIVQRWLDKRPIASTLW